MSKQLHVGVDLDGVLYPFEVALQEYLISHKGFVREDMALPWDSWDHWQKWGLTLNEFLDACHEATDAGIMFIEGDPYEGCIEPLVRLHDEGHKIHVITARNFGTRSPHNTADWLVKHDVPFDSLIMTEDKHIFRPDIMIDDYVKNFNQMWAQGTETWLLSRGWNADVDTEYRVDTLDQFANLVMEKANNGD